MAVVATPGEHQLPEMTPIWFEFHEQSIWFIGERTRRGPQRMDASRRAMCFVLDPANGSKWAQRYGRVSK